MANTLGNQKALSQIYWETYKSKESLFDKLKDRNKWLEDSMEGFIDGMKETGQWQEMTKKEKKDAAEQALIEADKNHHLLGFLCQNLLNQILNHGDLNG